MFGDAFNDAASLFPASMIMPLASSSVTPSILLFFPMMEIVTFLPNCARLTVFPLPKRRMALFSVKFVPSKTLLSRTLPAAVPELRVALAPVKSMPLNWLLLAPP